MAENLYSIKKVVLTELDPLTGNVKASNPIICVVDTAEEAEFSPLTSNGTEKIQRTDDKILAVASTPDLIYGYDFKLKDSTFDINVASLVEGGTIVRDGGNQIIGYNSPKLVDGATMKPFQVEIYVANYEGDSIVNYKKITLSKCTGKASKLSFKKDFFSPEFNIKARENTLANKPMISTVTVATLPTTDIVAPILTRNGSGSITIPAAFVGKLDELGTIYIVPSAAIITAVSQLTNIVSTGMGKYGTMLSAGVDISIATTGLTAGAYKAYGVDIAGNISTGTAVTLA